MGEIIKIVKKSIENIKKILEKFPYLLLLLRWALMCRWMMKRRWKIRWLKICGLMHARSMLTRRKSTGSSTAARCVSGVGWTSTRQTYAATVTCQTLLWKIKLFEKFLMNLWENFCAASEGKKGALPEPQSLKTCQHKSKPFFLVILSDDFFAIKIHTFMSPSEAEKLINTSKKNFIPTFPLICGALAFSCLLIPFFFRLD